MTERFDIEPIDVRLEVAHGAFSDTAVNPALVYLRGLHSASSRRSMASKLNVAARLLGFPDLRACPWAALRAEHLVGIMSKLSEDGGRHPEVKAGRSAVTINCFLAALKGVAKAAWLSRLLASEDYQRICAVKEYRVVREAAGRSLSFGESRALLSDCDPETAAGARDRAILLLMLGSGLRRGEIPDIRFERYSPAEGALRLIGKGDKERTAILADEVMVGLNHWIDRFRGREPGLMFGRIRKGGRLDLTAPLDARSIGVILKAHCEGAGIDARTTPHDLRRTFATRLLDENVDVATVKDMMGHASIATTVRYDRRGDEALRRAAKLIRL